jgi:hypothetical protein
VCTRNGSQLVLYHNGAALISGVSAPVKLPDRPLVIGSALYDAKGTFDSSGDTFAWAFYGSGLNQADVTALTNLLSVFPTFNGGVAAANRGFTSSKFSYNFATRGLGGVDVRGTMSPGYSFYPSFWLGAGNTRAASFGYSDGLVTMGSFTYARMGTAGYTGAGFTATISGTTMTVTNIVYGMLALGQVVAGSPALSGQSIVSQLSGTAGGVGTYRISSAAAIPSSANLSTNAYTGTTFAPGGYYEATFSFVPNSTAPYGFPAFWLSDVAGLQASNLNSGFGQAARWGELDIYEAPHNTRPYGDMNAIDWTNTNRGGEGTYNLVVHEYSGATTNPNALHSYGMLWVPTMLNNGTGLIQFYLDRIPTGSQITYSSNAEASPTCSPSNLSGCLFILERGKFVLMFDAGGAGSAAYPINILSVNVWH